LKSAIVTGASSGIGLECAKKLLEMDFIVYGIGRDFSKCALENMNFHKIVLDLKDVKELEKLKIKSLKVLINSAGVGHFAPAEDLSFEKIEQMITINLTAPLLLTKLFLKDLKLQSGYIFNINSISAIQPALYGAVYGATKAGLRHFGTSLFKEARKSGLKVININPDITDTPFFDKLHFKPTNDPLTYIKPSDIANVIEDILNLREGTVVSDITIEPQKFQISKK
jgi:hypothetical protein